MKCSPANCAFPAISFAQFDCSFRIPYHVFMEIVGDEGTLSIPQPFNPGAREALLPDPQGSKTETIAVKGHGTVRQRSGRHGGCHPARQAAGVSLADSRANMAAILALFEFGENWQTVSFVHEGTLRVTKITKTNNLKKKRLATIGGRPLLIAVVILCG